MRGLGRLVVSVNIVRGLFLLAIVIAGGRSMPAPAAQPAEANAAARAEAGIAYDVAITGVEGALETLIRELSVLVEQRGTAPRSYGALRSRIEEDIAMARRVLRSRGYYDAQITQRIDTERDPLEVELRIFTGPRYLIEDIALEFGDQPPEEAVIDALREAIALGPDDFARAAEIVAAEARLLAELPERGHPLAEKVDRRVVVAHARDRVAVTYRIDAGPNVLFGRTEYDGGTGIEHAYLDRLKPWEEGAVYDRRLVERFRRELVATRLFSQVRIAFAQPEEELRASAETIRPAIRVTLATAPLRTISIAGGFSTSEGIGAEVSWQHRNLLGRAERLTLTARAAEIEQSLSAEFRKPNFRRRDQMLTAGTGFIREDTDAFDSIEYNVNLGLERRLNDRWTLSAESELVATEVDDLDGERTFLIASLAAGLGYDSRDDLLNPTRGLYARFSTIPHLAEQNDLFTFVTNEFEASVYQALDEAARFVLAERVKLGSISGARRARLPANRRLFSGGGGSNRGFDFQEAGPLDAMGDPIGGRSLFEATLETRIRFGESYGVVPFLDVSRVWEDNLPQFDDLRWGAGIGFRYFTGFAPIRLDIAFPLNKRPTDDTVQIFISLGQSF